MCRPLFDRAIGWLCFGSLVFLSACSSSDNPAQLPDIAIDSTEPRALSFSPVLDSNTELSSNGTVSILFDELLNFASIQQGVSLFALKSRDIFSSGQDLEADDAREGIDSRPWRGNSSAEVVTVSVVREVGERFDEDSEEFVPITETNLVERFATRLTLFGYPRLALSTDYAFVLDPTIKDLSPIESINPETNLPDTGNFLRSGLSIQFRTADGDWQPETLVNNQSQVAGAIVGKTDFLSQSGSGQFVWLQTQDYGSGIVSSRLQRRAYDYDAQRLGTETERYDYIAAVDTDTVPLSTESVGGFDSAVVGDAVCSAWISIDSVLVPSTNTLFARCSSSVTDGKRIVVRGIDTAFPVEDIRITEISSNQFVLSYLRNGVVQLDLLGFDDSFALSTLDDLSFGTVTQIVREYEAKGIRGSDGTVDISILISYDEGGVVGSPGNAIEAERYGFQSGEFSFVSSARLDEDSAPFGDLSLGFDFLGLGFAGWLNGLGNDRSFYTAKYNGQLWADSVLALKDGRGPVTSAKVSVFEDGQALFVWAQDIGATVEIRAQGEFFTDSGLSRSRPNVLTLDSNTSLSDLVLETDREGNAQLLYRGPTGVSQSIRFLHNTRWDNAWSDPESLTDDVKTGSLGLFKVLEDGRMILTSINSMGAFDMLFARIYSDYE